MLEKLSESATYTLQEDTLVIDNHKFNLDGTGIDTPYSLNKLPAYQEFWHSWRTFQLHTLKHE